MTAATLHLLIVSINTARLCLAELGENNRETIALRTAIERFLVFGKDALGKKKFENLQDANFENVALIAELFPMLAMCPPDKTEQIIKGIEEIILNTEFTPETETQATETTVTTETKTTDTSSEKLTT
jgi:hypothetical protein